MEMLWLVGAFIGIVLLALILPKLGPPAGPGSGSGIKVRFSNDPLARPDAAQRKNDNHGHKTMVLTTILGISTIAAVFAFPVPAASDLGEPTGAIGHLTMALTQVQHGDAAISVQELVASDAIPKPARRLYQKALESDRKGQTDSALEQARAAIGVFTRYFQAEAALAVGYLKRGNLSEAQRHVQIAAALNPHYLPAQEIQGLIFFFQGRIQDAADVLGELVKTAPCRETVHYYLALALRELGHYKKADYHLQTAQLLLLNPMSSRPEDPAAGDRTAFPMQPRVH
jgi:tetratricopeptide (TPR) repeat protein